MPIKRFLFGPDWRSRSPERRLRAILESQDPNLERELPTIAREDPDERVRLAALKRLDDPRRYLEAARSDPSLELRREAHALAMRQLAGERPSALSEKALALVAAELLGESDIESLLRRARSSEVRRTLIAKSNRSALLVELAVSDPDPELRRMALERVEDPAALERLARRARGKDRRIERLAVERLAALRRSSGADDPQAIEELCRQAEAALRDPPRELAAFLARLRADVEALRLSADDPRAVRLRNALAILDRFAARGNAADAQPASAPTAETLPCSTGEAPIDDKPEPAAPTPANEPPPAAEAGSADERQGGEARKTAPSPDPETNPRQLLQRLAAAVEEGMIGDAEALFTVLRGLSLRGSERARLQALARRIAELRRWKSWTLREHREGLLREMAALSGAGLHPDALAARIGELRTQWRLLHREMPAPPALEGRFHALARSLLAPARDFFRRRDELRARRRQDIEAMLTTTEAALAASDQGEEAASRKTAAALASMRRRLVALMRELPELAPEDRARLGERLRQALAALDQRREVAAGKALTAKRTLLQRLEQAAALPPERALRELERVEAKWRGLGRATPPEEAALRERLAAMAARIREAHREHLLAAQRAEAERRAEAEALLRRAEALGDAPNPAEVERLADDARRLRPMPSELQHALATAIAEARRRALAAMRARLAAELRALLSAPTAQSTAPSAEAEAAARRCCTALEELAGVASPAEDAELRLRLQMERLAARLGRGEAEDPLPAARALLGEWQRIAKALTDPQPFTTRLERAIEALADRLHPDPPRRASAAGGAGN